jgi:hypothetical protein
MLLKAKTRENSFYNCRFLTANSVFLERRKTRETLRVKNPGSNLKITKMVRNLRNFPLNYYYRTLKIIFFNFK